MARSVAQEVVREVNKTAEAEAAVPVEQPPAPTAPGRAPLARGHQAGDAHKPKVHVRARAFAQWTRTAWRVVPAGVPGGVGGRHHRVGGQASGPQRCAQPFDTGVPEGAVGQGAHRLGAVDGVVGRTQSDAVPGPAASGEQMAGDVRVEEVSTPGQEHDVDELAWRFLQSDGDARRASSSSGNRQRKGRGRDDDILELLYEGSVRSAVSDDGSSRGVVHDEVRRRGFAIARDHLAHPKPETYRSPVVRTFAHKPGDECREEGQKGCLAVARAQRGGDGDLHGALARGVICKELLAEAEAGRKAATDAVDKLDGLVGRFKVGGDVGRGAVVGAWQASLVICARKSEGERQFTGEIQRLERALNRVDVEQLVGGRRRLPWSGVSVGNGPAFPPGIQVLIVAGNYAS